MSETNAAEQADRVYEPSPEFVRQARVQGMDAYRALYEAAKDKPEEFWGELAEKELFWFEKWTHVFEWDPPFAKWFVGGKINASYNCLDRHLTTPRKNKVAILWEGEPGDQRMISYQELHRLVCRFANVLKARGLQGRRPRHHLHGHGAGAAGRPAGLRAARHHSQRGVRRLLGGGAEGAHSGPRSRQWSSRPTARWRRGKEVRLKDAVDEVADGLPDRARRDRLPAHRRRSPDEGRPRPLVARSRRKA